MKTKEGLMELNQEKFQFAKYSVYYDAVLNPFGAPPPGKPALYWAKDGKSTTMNIREANIPESLRESLEKEHEALERKRAGNNKRRQRRWDEEEDEEGDRSNEFRRHDREGGTTDSMSHQHSALNHIPVRPSHPSIHETKLESDSHPPPPPPPPPPLPSDEPVPPPPPPKPLVPPPPPPPSKSVERLNKRKKKGKGASLLADIWASNDEINYDTTSGNGVPMEGFVDPNKTKEKQESTHVFKRRKKGGGGEEERFDPLCPSGDGYSDYRSEEQIKRSTVQAKTKMAEKQKKQDSTEDAWYYRDSSNALQGPFQSVQMNGWKQAGFFPDQTPVRRGLHGDFVPMGTVEFLQSSTAHDANEEGIQSRIAALKRSDADGGNSVQDRIAALRGESSSTERIARTQNENISEQGNEQEVINGGEADEEEEAEVQSRILALRESSNCANAALTNESNSLQNEDEPRIARPTEQDLEGPIARAEIEQEDKRDIALNTEGIIDPTVVIPNDTSGAPSNAQLHASDAPLVSEESAAYPLGHIHQNNADDTPYPVLNDQYGDNAGDVPYPIESLDDMHDIPYPVDEPYGGGDEFTYPNTDAAYSDEITSEVAPYYYPDEPKKIEENEVKQAPKKKYTGDKAVVGFVPSNLQVRRSKNRNKHHQ